MIVRCWGSRGSIAVSGREYVRYGGDTSCVEVQTGSGEVIILDAGTGIRALGKRLAAGKARRINLLLTHAHWDHLSGFPFFKPLYRKGFEIRIYGPEPTQHSLRRIISKTMSAPNFPVDLADISARMEFLGMGHRNYSIASVRVTTAPLSHTNPGVGYRLEEDGKSFVFLTDNELRHRHRSGLDYADYARFAAGADLLFHDAEFTRKEYRVTKGWGHSAYLDTLGLAMDAGVRTLGLFHHNQERTDRGVERIVDECRGIIERNGSRLKCFAVATGTRVRL